MKKIGIITINDYQNYGNRLQNYATQEVLKSIGYFAKTIANKPIYVYSYNNNNCGIKRMEALKNFTEHYIMQTNYCVSDDNIPDDLGEKYDYFITGSDQIWNPIFRHGSPIDFLTFAPSHKRIAYCPSFGITEIPSNCMVRYRNWLSEINKLSVREDSGAKIIKDLTGRNATVLVDPTLMLTKRKWLSISKVSANKPQGEYLLTYFLSKMTKENESKICSIAKKCKLKIVNLVDMRDEKTYIADPSEFIDYINSARIILTDSFHGVVFSILFGKPFIVFDRITNQLSMNSRIDTLLRKFNLSTRRISNIKNDKQILEADYSYISPILKSERKKAIDYLKKALN